MGLQRPQQAPARDVPEAQQAVTSTGNDRRSVGSKRRIGQEVRIATKDLATASGRGAPEPGRTVGASREDLAPAGYEACGEHSSDMPLELGDEPTLLKVPECRRSLLASDRD